MNRPHIDLPRQKQGTRIYVETERCVWEFILHDPSNAIVLVRSTDDKFKDSRNPIMGQLVESAEPLPGTGKRAASIVLGWPFELRFQNVNLRSFIVKSARIEGDGWHYEI